MNYPIQHIALCLTLALQPGLGAAQPITDAERMDNICELNASSAFCAARMEGKAKAEGLDLSQSVKIGEASSTSPVTTGEIAACWATWVAIRERIAVKGRDTFPSDYTLAALDRRILDWRSVLLRSAKGDEMQMQEYARPALGKARADVSGPKIILAAEMSGACKALPQ